jgi:hypothetical protein
VSPDLLAANLSRVRAEQGSRSSSIPPTPAPTPNLLTHNHMVPEQVIGVSELLPCSSFLNDEIEIREVHKTRFIIECPGANPTASEFAATTPAL